jgi:hypothetical protein
MIKNMKTQTKVPLQVICKTDRSAILAKILEIALAAGAVKSKDQNTLREVLNLQPTAYLVKTADAAKLLLDAVHNKMGESKYQRAYQLFIDYLYSVPDTAKRLKSRERN